MHFTTTLALAALASVASAQMRTAHVVTVGMNGELKFSPENLQANVGDVVQFQFVAGNHTVTQSNFDNPCNPIGQFTNITGFHSGNVPVAASADQQMAPTFSIMINNTNPIWIYCATGQHCENGMTMVINENTSANATRSLANHKALAAGATTSVPSGTPDSGTGTGTDTGTDTETGTGTGGGDDTNENVLPPSSSTVPSGVASGTGALPSGTGSALDPTVTAGASSIMAVSSSSSGLFSMILAAAGAFLFL